MPRTARRRGQHRSSPTHRPARAGPRSCRAREAVRPKRNSSRSCRSEAARAFRFVGPSGRSPDSIDPVGSFLHSGRAPHGICLRCRRSPPHRSLERHLGCTRNSSKRAARSACSSERLRHRARPSVRGCRSHAASRRRRTRRRGRSESPRCLFLGAPKRGRSPSWRSRSWSRPRTRDTVDRRCSLVYANTLTRARGFTSPRGS